MRCRMLPLALLAGLLLGSLAAAGWAEDITVTYTVPAAPPQIPDFAALSKAASEAKTAALNRRVKRIYAENVPAYAIFLALAEKAGIRSVGVELLATDQTEKLVSLEVTDGIVFDAFDRVHFADPRYSYETGMNYFPRGYEVPGTREAGSAVPPRVPPPYLFLSEIESLQIVKKAPGEALAQVLSLECVRSKPPGLPIQAVTSAGPWSHPELKLVRNNIRVRTALNLIALAAGKNWMARYRTDTQGKPVAVEVRLFDAAVQVCPDVAKVQVELE